MRPSTKRLDKEVWQLWQKGVAPKDIATALNVTISQVYKGIYREKRRRGVPIQPGVGRGKNRKKREKRRARASC